jgi:hypothetical protein
MLREFVRVEYRRKVLRCYRGKVGVIVVTVMTHTTSAATLLWKCFVAVLASAYVALGLAALGLLNSNSAVRFTLAGCAIAALVGAAHFAVSLQVLRNSGEGAEVMPDQQQRRLFRRD